MTPAELQKYLHDHIPLSAAMQVSVVEVASDSVIVSAPLSPNTEDEYIHLYGFFSWSCDNF
jgi:hypothetical protein